MFRLGVVLRSTAIIIVPEGTTIVGHSAACEMRKRGAWALLASFSTRAGLPA
jgi:hypothetical protein